jgi:hypothetical protein
MASWPDQMMLKRRLGITSSDGDDDLDLALEAAIEQVKLDVGAEEDIVTPSASMAQAAILLAVACFKAVDAPHGVVAIFDVGGIQVAKQDPHYMRLLVGQRQSFGIA